MSIFSLFPNAKSISIAALYGIQDSMNEFQLSDFIKIVPSNDIIESFYLPLMNKAFMKPTHYLVGCAEDERYRLPARKLTDKRDAESSLTLAQLALSIFYSSPFLKSLNIWDY